MFSWFKKRTTDKLQASDGGLRPVPGVGTFRDSEGRVIYNLLDPVMQQFLGRCVGAVKNAGIRAKGTGSFSVLLGESQRAELQLDPFWTEYCDSQDPGVFGRVAEAAKRMLRVG